MTLNELFRAYNELRDRKTSLEDDLKDCKDRIAKTELEITDAMIDEGYESVNALGYTYSLVEKTKYSKKSEADLADAGVDFFDVLRGEGLGDLIKETVSPQTLNSAIAQVVEENGGVLPDALSEVVNLYETTEISRRKSAKGR